MAMDNQAAGPATGNPSEGTVEGAGSASEPVTDFASELAGSGQGQALPIPAQAGQPSKEKEAQATPVLPGWTQATTKELRADPRLASYASKFKSFDDVVKSAMELESKAGVMVNLPTDKSTPEEVAAYYAKVGVPEKPEGYTLEKDPELQYDDKEIAAYQALAHKYHLNQEQAKGMFAEVSAQAKAALTAFKATEEQKAQAARTSQLEAKVNVEKALKKDWGKDYDANREIVKRGMTKFASPSLLAKARERGMGNEPEFIQLFYQIGQLVREDTALLDSSGGHGVRKSAAEVIYPNG